MQKTLPVTLIKGEKHSSIVEYRDVLPVNMYAVPEPVLGAQGFLATYPGIDSFGTAIDRDRGGVYNERQSKHFRVSGSRFISVSDLGVVTNIGSVGGDTQVSLPYSFNTQCVISNGDMFLYTSAGGLVQVTDVNIGTPIDGVWHNGRYFLTDGEYLYHTTLADETVIDTLAYASAEFMPDAIVALDKTQDNKVVVFGRYSIEYFVDVASENFAYTRIESRAQKIGIVATHAKTEVDNVFYIIGGGRNESIAIHAVTVGGVNKVSTREIDLILSEYSEAELSDVRLESRFEDGMTFIIIHLPTKTVCFNITVAKKIGIENAWSILKTGLQAEIYRAINGVYDPRINKWVYGDRVNNYLGTLNNEIFTQYDTDTPQEWLLYTPLVRLETFSVDELEIDTIPGFNIIDDTSVFISLSYDGVTFGMEYTLNYGDMHDYNKRFIVRQLGYVSDIIGFRFRGATRSKMCFSLMKVTYS